MKNCLFFVTILVIFTCFVACEPKPPTDDAAQKAEVNPTFEMDPPLSDNITIRELEKPINGGNVLVTATLDSQRVGGQFHAIMVGDEKMVLRDDGKLGDEKAGDGVFSIAFKGDLDVFRQEVEAARKGRQEMLEEKRPLLEFIGRSAVQVNDKMKGLDNRRLEFKVPFKFDRLDLFLPRSSAVNKEHSLMITDLSVVEDPIRTYNPCTNVGDENGVWTFKHLMTQMANQTLTGITPEQFTKEWLNEWLTAKTVNSDVIAPRTLFFNLVIRPWVQKSNPPGTSITISNWETRNLNLKFAPFKLLAIVNRLDLRGNSGYGFSNAGEGRFVFGVLNPNCSVLADPGKFTVIFEYGIPIKNCTALKAYGQQWKDLDVNTPLPNANYNAALETITNVFTKANADTNKPNKSALNQLRTNEFALTPGVTQQWELREFVIDAGTHLLESTTTKNEPAKIYNRHAVPPGTTPNLQIMADFVNNGGGTVPLMHLGQPFLGAKAHTETRIHFWDGNPIALGLINIGENRHKFSLNTCSGCHGGEGDTQVGNLINNPSGVSHDPFLHISPQPFGTKATLSAFITGDPNESNGLFQIVDPANRPATAGPGPAAIRGFNDLEQRAISLQNLLNTDCTIKIKGVLQALTFKPLNMEH